jgi:3-deoxy-7-phosphoheptulonate synthase
MIDVMKPAATSEHVAAIVERVESLGSKKHTNIGEERSVIGVIGDGRIIDVRQIGIMIGVETIVPISKPY